jgi:hypothetical protein
VTRFPNLNNDEKERLLKLFLISGQLRIMSESQYRFEFFEHSIMDELDKETGQLVYRAMTDLYDPRK